MNAERPVARMSAHIGAKPRLVALAGPVDVGRLVGEEIDRQRAFTLPAKQEEEDEQPAMMHADLGDVTAQPEPALRRVDRGDQAARTPRQPALNAQPAKPAVTLDVIHHRPLAR